MSINEFLKDFVFLYFDVALLLRYFAILGLFFANHAPEIHVPPLNHLLYLLDILKLRLMLQLNLEKPLLLIS